MTKVIFIQAYKLYKEIEDLKQTIETLKSNDITIRLYDNNKLNDFIIDRMGGVFQASITDLDEEARKVLINHYESKLAELEKQFEEL